MPRKTFFRIDVQSFSEQNWAKFFSLNSYKRFSFDDTLFDHPLLPQKNSNWFACAQTVKFEKVT
jgi:hypothetical protein